MTDATPLTLVDLVEKTSSRSRRTDAVQEYWKAAVALLDLRFAEEELAAIQRSPTPDSSLKRSAIASARARAAEAKMELRRQREELSLRYGATSNSLLPLPADKPFVGPYDTKILSIYTSRRPPRDAVELDRLIAETAEIAAARGEAAAHAAEARNAAGGTAEQYLAAFDRCRDARIAFLAAVRDYNLAIANYALYVSDPSLPPESVAKMLVDVPVASSDPIASRTAIVPASPALVSLLGPDEPSNAARDFAAGAEVGAAVRPASAELPSGAAPAVDAGAEANDLTTPPRELVPSDADQPMQADEAETPESEPTAGGLQPAGESLVPSDPDDDVQPSPNITGLQFSGAVVR